MRGLSRRRFLGLLASVPMAAACARLPQSSAIGSAASDAVPTQASPDVAPGEPARYFIDPSGDDTANGLTEAAAWRSVARVNQQELRPGDSVLLRRGGIWDQAIELRSGDVDRLVVYGAFGEGAAPIIDVAEQQSSAIVALAQSWIRLEGIHARRGEQFGIAFANCEHIEVFDCESDGSLNDQLIFIRNGDGTDGCSFVHVRGGRFHSANKPEGETYLATGIEVADGGHDILLEDFEAFGAIAGVSVHNHTFDDGTTTALPANVVIRNADCHDNERFGLLINKQADNPAATITIDSGRFVGNEEYGILGQHEAAHTDQPLAGVVIEGDVEATDNGIGDIQIEGTTG